MELKQSTGELWQIVETVGAFANGRGGTVLIGVTPQGHVMGVTIGKDTLEALANTIQQQTDPRVFPSLTIIREEERTVIVVQVEESPIKPVLVQGRGFRRVGRSNHVLTSTQLTQLFFGSGRLSWDAGPLAEASLHDIDAGTLRTFLRNAQQERNLAVDPETAICEALEKLEFLYHRQVSRATILLFSRRPQRFLLPAELQKAKDERAITDSRVHDAICSIHAQFMRDLRDAPPSMNLSVSLSPRPQSHETGVDSLSGRSPCVIEDVRK